MPQSGLTRQQKRFIARASEWKTLQSKDGRFTGTDRRTRRDMLHRRGWAKVDRYYMRTA